MRFLPHPPIPKLRSQQTYVAQNNCPKWSAVLNLVAVKPCKIYRDHMPVWFEASTLLNLLLGPFQLLSSSSGKMAMIPRMKLIKENICRIDGVSIRKNFLMFSIQLKLVKLTYKNNNNLLVFYLHEEKRL